MTDKKTIVVVGATGAQGGGLVRAIVADGEFTARAVTRNAGSDKAQALVDIGAEVVAADVDDIQSLKRAFDGAYGAFCVTFFWEHFSPEKELAQAQSMAEAAKYTGVQHVIWSTLEDTRKWIPLDEDRMPTLMEKYKVPHFDAKGEANGLFTDVGVPTTFLQTCAYWENFIYFGMGPKKRCLERRSADRRGHWATALELQVDAAGDRYLIGCAREQRCEDELFAGQRDSVERRR